MYQNIHTQAHIQNAFSWYENEKNDGPTVMVTSICHSGLNNKLEQRTQLNSRELKSFEW